jgi:hypothetical protein
MRILMVAEGWDFSTGGIATANRELAIGLAEAGHQVYCWLSGPESGSSGVELRWPDGVNDRVPGYDGAAMAARQLRLLQPGPLPEAIDMVVGHSRVTGDQAHEIRRRRYPHALEVRIVHNSPEEGERIRTGDGIAADQKARLELDRMIRSDLVVAVGPLIADEAALLAQRAGAAVRIHELIPGVSVQPVPDYRAGQSRFEVLFFGRADDPIKAGREAAEATAELNREASLFTSSAAARRETRYRAGSSS